MGKRSSDSHFESDCHSLKPTHEFQNRLKSLGFNYNDEVNERLDAVLSEKSQNEEIIQN